MEGEHLAIYEQILRVFASKLEIVTGILASLVEPEPDRFTSADAYGTKRVKYALKKRSLDKAIEELEIWQRTADPSWFLLMKIASPHINAAMLGGCATGSIVDAIPSVLPIRAGIQGSAAANTPDTFAKGLSFSAEELTRMEISVILFTDSSVGRRVDTGATYILNKAFCVNFSKRQIVKKDTRDLVRKLQHNEPQTFGLLSC